MNSVLDALVSKRNELAVSQKSNLAERDRCQARVNSYNDKILALDAQLDEVCEAYEKLSGNPMPLP